MSLKIAIVAGARPNFMKIAPILNAIKNYKQIDPIFIHTGQHYDQKMSDSFLKDLGLPKPDYYLGVGSASHAVQTAKIMMEFEQVVLKENPHLVMVVGDVNSTIACALVASKLHIPVSHIEAGLRSYDNEMPEEINRILTDRISDLLFTTCSDADENLIKEGVSKNKIFFVGNVMIESLINYQDKYENNPVYEQFKCDPQNYALVTLHRPSNVDDPEMFKGIYKALAQISSDLPVLFPVHPRTRARIQKFNMNANNRKNENLILTDPLGYFDFLALQKNARIVLTDSGGVQEETTHFKVPCLTLRENTERPITIHQGTNQLVPLDKESIVTIFKETINTNHKTMEPIKFWDDQVSKRIIEIVLNKFNF